MLKIVLLIGLFGSVANSQTQSEIEYKNGSVFFQTTKTALTLTFTDHLGERRLEIKDCNRKSVESFWKKLTDQIDNLRSAPKNHPPTEAWVKFEGLQFPVLQNELANQFLSSVPIKSHALFTGSRRLCKK
jgi:hypothetical protein